MNISLYSERHGREISVSLLFTTWLHCGHHGMCLSCPRRPPARASLFRHAMSTFSMRLLLGRMFWEGATHNPLEMHGKDSVTAVVCRPVENCET